MIAVRVIVDGGEIITVSLLVFLAMLAAFAAGAVGRWKS